MRHALRLLASIVALGCASAALPAQAAGFNGRYLHATDQWLAYFELVDRDSAIHGDYVFVTYDAKAPGGLRRRRYAVSGKQNGSHAVLHVFTAGARPYVWNARYRLSGFDVALPMANGGVAQRYYRYASAQRLAAADSGLVRAGARAHKEHVAREDLHRSVYQLQSGLRLRIQVAGELASARTPDEERTARARLARIDAHLDALRACIAQDQAVLGGR